MTGWVHAVALVLAAWGLVELAGYVAYRRVMRRTAE